MLPGWPGAVTFGPSSFCWYSSDMFSSFVGLASTDYTFVLVGLEIISKQTLFADTPLAH